MKKVSEKLELKRELDRLFKSMDFVSEKFSEDKKISKRDHQLYWNIYQQLGVAWEFLGLQCRHWDGYKKIKDKKEACRICGKIKSTDEHYYLLPKTGLKKIGKKSMPNSKKTFKNKSQAKIVSDTIEFHGAVINADVHNSYKSRMLNHTFNIAAERIITVKERGIECSIDQHLIHLKLNTSNKKIGKKKYGNFPWELKRQNLKNFPVIFEFDEKYKMLGLTILT